jgi:hypothetical protein
MLVLTLLHRYRTGAPGVSQLRARRMDVKRLSRILSSGDRKRLVRVGTMRLKRLRWMGRRNRAVVDTSSRENASPLSTLLKRRKYIPSHSVHRLTAHPLDTIDAQIPRDSSIQHNPSTPSFLRRSILSKSVYPHPISIPQTHQLTK